MTALVALVILAGLIGGGDRDETNEHLQHDDGAIRLEAWTLVRPASAGPRPTSVPIPTPESDTPRVVPRPVAPDTEDASGAARVVVCTPAWPWSCVWALAVIDCESTFRADAIATEVIDGVQYWFHGWWQIVSTSPDPGPLADPVYNTERAAEKYVTEGTGAWPNCGLLAE